MGCDARWDAREPDTAKQDECAQFLAAFWKRCGWEYEIFSEPLEGYFASWYAARDGVLRQRLCLRGVTAYCHPKSFVDEMDACRGQISFVFDNSPDLPAEERHRLITLERAEHLWQPKYREVVKRVPREVPLSPDTAVGFYDVGGYERFGSGYWGRLCPLFLVVKELFIPSLDVGDDYNIFAETEKDIRDQGLASALHGPEREQAIEALLSFAFEGVDRTERLERVGEKLYEVGPAGELPWCELADGAVRDLCKKDEPPDEKAARREAYTGGLRRRLNEFEWSDKLQRFFRENGLALIGDLTECALAELSDTPQVGRKGAFEIWQSLLKLGVDLEQVREEREEAARQKRRAQAEAEHQRKLDELRAIARGSGEPEVMLLPVVDLGLSRRCTLALETYGIDCIRDLLPLTPQEVLKFRNFGKKSLRELQDFLAEHGLSLATDPPSG